MGDTRVRLASISRLFPLLPALAVFGLAAGCGDNLPSQSSNAGTSGGGAGGSAGAGGGAAIDGSAATDGGAATDGSAATDGGAATDGSAGIGGIGGVSGTGGHGGIGGIGGIGGTAGGGTGGHVTDAGIDTPPPIPCYATAFTAPTNGSTLTVADDTDHSCLNGFQYTVTITSAAPAGTAVQLFDGTSLLKSSTVSGGTASFAVQLPSTGTTQLAIQYPTTLACTVEANVTVTCPNSPPTCSISKPTISATHPDLNGVAAPAGDRTSSPGSAYQATFVVNTNAEDGQVVTLAVDNAAAPSAITLLNATVAGASATFGVTLVPDGTYEVTATCKNLAGITGTSTKSTFPVDTTPPVLTVNSPASGQFFGPPGSFQACAQTSSPDAAGLSSSLGVGAQKNLCVALGGSSASSCVAVAAVNTSTCISLSCPGAAPFGLFFTLTDAAGNPTTQTVTGVSCASLLPLVQIIAPLSDSAPFSDQSKHILSATAPVGVPDEDPVMPGAQADVVACTDTNGSATLFQGHKGDLNLGQLGTPVNTVPALASDGCPAGLGFIARFPGVTLFESNETGTGALTAATEMKVTLTSAINTAAVGTSLPVDVWVDTLPPAFALTMPPGLCGSFTQSPTTVTENLVFTAEDDLVNVQVQNGASTTTYDTPAFIGGAATFSNVAFTAGQNNVSATEDDPAGNETSMTPVPCAVTIGSAPVVTFTTPVPNALLCPSGATDTDCIDDTDPGTPGWQGNLAVTVTANGGAAVPDGTGVTFTVGGTTLGVATTVGGSAQVNGISLADGLQTITATTDNVPNAGVGVGTVNVTVDTGAPDAPVGPLNVSVTDRRKTSMLLTWTAPSDSNGGSIAGYEVRYAKVPITAANFDTAGVTTVVPYLGSPASPGQLDGLLVSPLYIENGYYFGVEATDIAGTRSAMLATPAAGACTCASQCCAAHFNASIINSPAGTNQSFGASIDGSQDVNGDGLSDLLVGTAADNHAYLFFGNTNFAPSTPNVTFTGVNVGFGATVRQIGDIDGDGLQDLAIADRPTGLRVFIYKGRLNWPATLTDAQADYVITTDATYAGSQFGSTIDRLGDFDGDGVADFAISAPLFNSRVGRVLVVYGGASFTSFTAANAARAREIGGDPALARTQFGGSLVGLGHFYTATTGTTLIVSAPGLGVQPSANAGRLYAFHGRGPGAPIDATSADNVLIGPATGALIGNILTNLGPVTGGLNSVGSSNLSDAVSVPGNSGTGFVLSGTAVTGPFANSIVVYKSGTNLAGQVFFGGGFSGLDTVASIIGSSTPDIAISGQVGSTLDIVDGSKLAALTSPINTTNAADVHVPMPSGWLGTPNGSRGLIRDINNDGYPDFTLGDIFGTVPGRVAVFW